MISPGEIAVGMYVTVIANKPLERQDFTATPFGIPDPDGSGVVTIANEDRSGYGDCLLVKAVQLPYVVLAWTEKGILQGQTFKMDTRKSTFMELSPEYVKAMLG